MIVLLGALAILVAISIAIWRGGLPRWYWRLFLAGAAIGLVWEIAFTFGGMGYPIAPGGAPLPGGEDIADLPLPAIIAIIALVCIWDGGLFVAGLVLARLLLGAGIERRASWAAFIIMQAWGQAQSFAVEITAINNGMWAYAATPRNPQLFAWGEAQITFWPQAVWVLGYCAFYAATLTTARRITPPPAP